MLQDIIVILRADRGKVAREALGLAGLCVAILSALALPAFAW